MKRQFDIVFLVGGGIGNVVEALYAVEYCLRNGKRTGLCLSKIAPLFISFLRESYGDEVILKSLDGLVVENLVHSYLYSEKIAAQFEHYFYIYLDHQSTRYLSETEQYLSIARALYPSTFGSKVLTNLTEEYSPRIAALDAGNKIAIYPGCDFRCPTKRWPYFFDLINKIGTENIVVVGGLDDLNYEFSYFYPKWITQVVPGFILRRMDFYNLCRRLGLLGRHAHLNGIEKYPISYFDIFSWKELAALFKRIKFFIGNDGGLTHLAAACGAPGLVIFGPTSVDKNRAYNDKMTPLSRSFDCQPCQHAVNGRDRMAKDGILCPYQIRCLHSIGADEIVSALGNAIQLSGNCK